MSFTPNRHPVLPPEWLAHRYDPAHDAVHLVKADREQRASAAFFTDEYLSGVKEPLIVSRDEALAVCPPEAPVHFIFHSAYCCSTLLARAYERPGLAVSIREPVILNDISGWRHRGAPAGDVEKVLDSCLRLLARPFEAGEAAVIKPSNLANAFASAMLRIRPSAKAVLLYAPLETYLASIARKGLWGRLWVRDLLLKQLKDGLVDLGFEPEQHLLQSDLQVAAVGWLTQHRLFGSLLAQYPDRLLPLSSNALTSDPISAVAAIDRLFGVRSSDADRTVTVGSIFQRHSKFGGEFTPEDRAAAEKSGAELHRDEIEKVLVWAAAVADAAGVRLQL